MRFELEPRNTVAMLTEIPLRWKATRFNNDPPLVDDGGCYDAEAVVGRVRLDTMTNPKGWRWSLTACGFGRDHLTTSGVEDDKENAKACLEAAYRALLAADPRNRESVQAHRRRTSKGRR